MTDNIRRPGIGHVGSFQVSGYPWITGSTVPSGEAEVQVSFPTVTKGMQIRVLTGEEMRLHFASLSAGNVYSGGHYITLPSGSVSAPSLTELSAKCKSVWLSAPAGSGGGDFQILAELTHINEAEMYNLTGSGHTE